MKYKKMISSRQLFFMLYASYTISLLTSASFATTKSDFSKIIIFSPLLLIAQLLLPLPIILLYSKNERLNLIDNANYAFGKAISIIIAVGYILLFLYSPIVSIVKYERFISTTMLPNVSIVILSIAIVVTALYGSILGLQALARGSAIVLIFIVLSLALIFLSVFSKVEVSNLSTINNVTYENFFFKSQSISYVSSIMEISTLAILLPYTKNNKANLKRSPFKNIFYPYIGWSVGQVATVLLIAVSIVGVLGSYANNQPYPFYTLSNISSLGSLQRLDAFVCAVWTMGLYIKTSLFLLSISLCVKSVWGENVGKIALLVSAIIILVSSIILSNYNNILKLLTTTKVSTSISVSFFFVIPLLIYIFVKARTSGSKGGNV